MTYEATLIQLAREAGLAVWRTYDFPRGGVSDSVEAVYLDVCYATGSGSGEYRFGMAYAQHVYHGIEI